jgi:hypothetical protein
MTAICAGVTSSTTGVGAAVGSSVAGSAVGSASVVGTVVGICTVGGVVGVGTGPLIKEHASSSGTTNTKGLKERFIGFFPGICDWEDYIAGGDGSPLTAQSVQ